MDAADPPEEPIQAVSPQAQQQQQPQPKSQTQHDAEEVEDAQRLQTGLRGAGEQA